MLVDGRKVDRPEAGDLGRESLELRLPGLFLCLGRKRLKHLGQHRSRTLELFQNPFDAHLHGLECKPLALQHAACGFRLLGSRVAKLFGLAQFVLHALHCGTRGLQFSLDLEPTPELALKRGFALGDRRCGGSDLLAQVPAAVLEGIELAGDAHDRRAQRFYLCREGFPPHRQTVRRLAAFAGAGAGRVQSHTCTLTGILQFLAALGVLVHGIEGCLQDAPGFLQGASL